MPASRLDGTKPKKTPKPIPWEDLRIAFIHNDKYQSPRTWLREMQSWPENRINSGSTKRRITGWGLDRAQYQHRRLEAAKEVQKELFAKLGPKMMQAKRKIIDKIIEKIKSVHDISDLHEILNILKVELGEPTTVTKAQVGGDESVDKAMEEIRNVVNAGRKTADAGRGAKAGAPAGSQSKVK